MEDYLSWWLLFTTQWWMSYFSGKLQRCPSKPPFVGIAVSGLLWGDPLLLVFCRTERCCWSLKLCAVLSQECKSVSFLGWRFRIHEVVWHFREGKWPVQICLTCNQRAWITWECAEASNHSLPRKDFGWLIRSMSSLSVILPWAIASQMCCARQKGAIGKSPF